MKTAPITELIRDYEVEHFEFNGCKIPYIMVGDVMLKFEDISDCWYQDIDIVKELE